MYLIDMVAPLVSPYIKSLLKRLSDELPSQAPIRELSVRETEQKNVAADVFDWIADRAVPTSLLST